MEREFVTVRPSTVSRDRRRYGLMYNPERGLTPLFHGLDADH